MKHLIIISLLLIAIMAHAEVSDDARVAIDDGDYASAIMMLRAELERNPSSQSNGALHLLLGEALYHEDRIDEARTAFEGAEKRSVPEAALWLGRLAAENYEFSKAVTYYNKYVSLKQKASQPVDAQVETDIESARLGASHLERVQRLTVIDSIAVPRNDFFKNYRLPSSAGHLLDAGAIPTTEGRESAAMAFASEGGEMMMWAEPDSLGVSRLVESLRLTDGTWMTPVVTDSTINIGDADFPFMMADGSTLYFAARGPRSIGGYDIFVASRNAMDNTYRLPQNLGMPINSPFDDYMLAIDEETGVGWWATDRNRLGDKVTIYLFVPWELRENYEADTPDIVSLARLSDYRATWPDDADFSSVLATVAGINNKTDEPVAQFSFNVPGKGVYTRYEDFSSDRAADLMEQYLSLSEQLALSEKQLLMMRKDFRRSPGRQAGAAIERAEKERDTLMEEVRSLRSKIIKAETSKN